MAEQFYSILTSIGKAKIANASVFGTKLNLTTLALGDGNGKYYNPTESQEALVNEVWRGNVGAIATDSENSNWIVIETMIAGNVGGFFIREVGVFDDEGSLIAIGKYPETYKPIVSDGATKDLIIRMILEVDNASSVTLKIDPTTVIATKKDIEILDNKIKNIKIPVTKVNNKLGDVTLKAEDIKTNNDKTIEENLEEVTSQMAEITKQIESIEVTAEKATLDSDKFTSKNVKAGMEELFTFADNGKKNIATVIGSPLSNTDSFDSMKSKIQTMKNTFASNLTAKEQNSSGNESLNNLINKVGKISTKFNISDLVANNDLDYRLRQGGVIEGENFIEFRVEHDPEYASSYIKKRTCLKSNGTLLSNETIYAGYPLQLSMVFSKSTSFSNGCLTLTEGWKPRVLNFSGTVLYAGSTQCDWKVHHNGWYFKVNKDSNNYYALNIVNDGTIVKEIIRKDIFIGYDALYPYDFNNYLFVWETHTYILNTSTWKLTSVARNDNFVGLLVALNQFRVIK